MQKAEPGQRGSGNTVVAGPTGNIDDGDLVRATNAFFKEAAYGRTVAQCCLKAYEECYASISKARAERTSFDFTFSGDGNVRPIDRGP